MPKKETSRTQMTWYELCRSRAKEAREIILSGGVIEITRYNLVEAVIGPPDGRKTVVVGGVK